MDQKTWDNEQIANSGGITQLHRILDMIRSGHDIESIEQWCLKEIKNRSPEDV